MMFYSIREVNAYYNDAILLSKMGLVMPSAEAKMVLYTIPINEIRLLFPQQTSTILVSKGFQNPGTTPVASDPSPSASAFNAILISKLDSTHVQ